MQAKALFSGRASLKKIPTFALPRITIKKTLKPKAPHTTLALWVLPCIYARISFLARALLCRNRRLVFHVSQEANVRDICLNSISQRQPCIRKMISCISAYCGGAWWRSKPKLLLTNLLQGWQPAVRERPSSTGPAAHLHRAAPGVKHHGRKAWGEWTCKMHAVIMAKTPRKVMFQFSVLPDLGWATLNQTHAHKKALNSLLFITSNEKECLNPRKTMKQVCLPGQYLL